MTDDGEDNESTATQESQEPVIQQQPIVEVEEEERKEPTAPV